MAIVSPICRARGGMYIYATVPSQEHVYEYTSMYCEPQSAGNVAKNSATRVSWVSTGIEKGKACVDPL